GTGESHEPHGPLPQFHWSRRQGFEGTDEAQESPEPASQRKHRCRAQRAGRVQTPHPAWCGKRHGYRAQGSRPPHAPQLVAHPIWKGDERRAERTGAPQEPHDARSVGFPCNECRSSRTAETVADLPNRSRFIRFRLVRTQTKSPRIISLANSPSPAASLTR